jgi:hypothetical protein
LRGSRSSIARRFVNIAAGSDKAWGGWRITQGRQPDNAHRGTSAAPASGRQFTTPIHIFIIAQQNQRHFAALFPDQHKILFFDIAVFFFQFIGFLPLFDVAGQIRKLFHPW